MVNFHSNGVYVACSSLLEGTMTRNRTKVWDLNYVTVIMSESTKIVGRGTGGS